MNWELISEELAYNGPYGRKIANRVFKLPDGSIADFYVRIEGDACATVAITEDNMVILTKQFRPGPLKYMTDLPAGAVDKTDSSPLEAAKRELLEETGYTGDFQYVGPCVEDAYSTMTRHCAVATNCRKVTEQSLSQSEFVDVVMVSIDEFRQILRNGQLTDVELGYMGLDFLGLL